MGRGISLLLSSQPQLICRPVFADVSRPQKSSDYIVLYNYPAVASYSKETDQAGKTGRVVPCEDLREFRLDLLSRKVPSFPGYPAQVVDALAFRKV